MKFRRRKAVRLVTVPFFPLSPDVMAQIVRLQLNRISKRVRANHGAEFVYDDGLVNAVQAWLRTGYKDVVEVRMAKCVPTNSMRPRRD